MTLWDGHRIFKQPHSWQFGSQSNRRQVNPLFGKLGLEQLSRKKCWIHNPQSHPPPTGASALFFSSGANERTGFSGSVTTTFMEKLPTGNYDKHVRRAGSCALTQQQLDAAPRAIPCPVSSSSYFTEHCEQQDFLSLPFCLTMLWQQGNHFLLVLR